MIKRVCDICGEEKEIYFKCKIKRHTLHIESYGVFDDPMFFRSEICEDCLKKIAETLFIGGQIMATVKCAYGKRARVSHEWNDGEKDRIYCQGRIDLMTDELLDVCKNCRDCVIYAQEDLDAWNRRKNDERPEVSGVER